MRPEVALPMLEPLEVTITPTKWADIKAFVDSVGVGGGRAWGGMRDQGCGRGGV